MTRCEFAIRSPLSGVIHGIDLDHIQAAVWKFKAATAAGIKVIYTMIVTLFLSHLLLFFFFFFIYMLFMTVVVVDCSARRVGKS